jgi:hypothetical protein
MPKRPESISCQWIRYRQVYLVENFLPLHMTIGRVHLANRAAILAGTVRPAITGPRSNRERSSYCTGFYNRASTY